MRRKQNPMKQIERLLKTNERVDYVLDGTLIGWFTKIGQDTVFIPV